MIYNPDNLNGNINLFDFTSKIDHAFKMLKGIIK
jgi:hypothetical protein